MNYPTTHSNIGDIAFLDSLSTTSVYLQPQQIEIYGSDLIEAAEGLENGYEHLNEFGVVSELHLTHSEIASVLMTKLYALCEEYLNDIDHHVRHDAQLKQMIERKVQLNQAA